jgi:hypothetical protein
MATSASKVITKAIRLTPLEEAQINEFLASNPFFDFSSLARTAILSFVRQPTVVIKPIKDAKHSVKRGLSV